LLTRPLAFEFHSPATAWQIDNGVIEMDPLTNEFTVTFPAATGASGYLSKGKFTFYKRAAAGGTDPKKACLSQGGVNVTNAEIVKTTTNTPNGASIANSNPARYSFYQKFKFGTIRGDSTIYVPGAPGTGTGYFHVCIKFSLYKSSCGGTLMNSKELCLSVLVQLDGDFSGSNVIKVLSLTPQGQALSDKLMYTCHAALCPDRVNQPGSSTLYPLHQVGGLGGVGDGDPAISICFYSDKFSTSGVKIVNVTELLLSLSTSSTLANLPLAASPL
jgi:hypothetical protein